MTHTAGRSAWRWKTILALVSFVIFVVTALVAWLMPHSVPPDVSELPEGVEWESPFTHGCAEPGDRAIVTLDAGADGIDGLYKVTKLSARFSQSGVDTAEVVNARATNQGEWGEAIRDDSNKGRRVQPQLEIYLPKNVSLGSSGKIDVLMTFDYPAEAQQGKFSVESSQMSHVIPVRFLTAAEATAHKARVSTKNIIGIVALCAFLLSAGILLAAMNREERRAKEKSKRGQQQSTPDGTLRPASKTAAIAVVIAFLLPLLSIPFLIFAGPFAGYALAIGGPLVSLVIALLALAQIRNSGGPMRGRVTARIACVLSVIFLALAPLTVSALLRDKSKSNNTSFIRNTKAILKAEHGALKRFHRTVGRYPTTEEGIGALLDADRMQQDADKWAGPYLSGPFAKDCDAWGRPMLYECDGESGSEYRLWSAGPDGVSGTDDDIRQ